MSKHQIENILDILFIKLDTTKVKSRYDRRLEKNRVKSQKIIFMALEKSWLITTFNRIPSNLLL